ncbi:MAG TPA: YggT family protein [Clostridiales bacterium]|nr:YggT family protein [Clostridiales bacterium]
MSALQAVLLDAVDFAYRVFFVLLLARALASWLPGSGPTYYGVLRVLRRLTDPILVPIRRWLPPIHGLDLSPLLALILLGLVRRLLVSLILALPG